MFSKAGSEKDISSSPKTNLDDELWNIIKCELRNTLRREGKARPWRPLDDNFQFSKIRWHLQNNADFIMVDLRLNSWKYEKFEFRKNFVTMFLSVENGPENRIFENFSSPKSRKIAQRNSKLRVKYLPENGSFEKIFFHQNQREMMIACHSFAKNFDLRFKN